MQELKGSGGKWRERGRGGEEGRIRRLKIRIKRGIREISSRIEYQTPVWISIDNLDVRENGKFVNLDQNFSRYFKKKASEIDLIRGAEPIVAAIKEV